MDRSSNAEWAPTRLPIPLHKHFHSEALVLKRYALYVFDYGAPTGFRLAMAHPERITAIVSQNGNAL